MGHLVLCDTTLGAFRQIPDARFTGLTRDPGQSHQGMTKRTPIYVVCSPRPRVGKTFVARLIVDFLRFDEKPVNAFDVNPHEPILAQFIPNVVEVIDLSNTRDQMEMFDRLIRDDEVPKVVDLGHTSYATFFNVAEEIEFSAEADRRGIEPVIVFPVDANPASGPAYVDLAKRFRGITLIPVFNDAIAKGQLYRDRFPLVHSVSVPLRIPVLAPGLKTYADKPAYSFADFYETLPIEIPLGISFELRAWTKRVFLEFRELELRMLLRKLNASLRESLSPAPSPDRLPISRTR